MCIRDRFSYLPYKLQVDRYIAVLLIGITSRHKIVLLADDATKQVRTIKKLKKGNFFCLSVSLSISHTHTSDCLLCTSRCV